MLSDRPSPAPLDRRKANERIRELTGMLLSGRGGGKRGKYLCECGSVECLVAVELTLEEFDAIRSYRSTLVVAGGHEGWLDEVLERNARFTLVSRRQPLMPADVLSGQALRSHAEGG